MSTIPYLIKQFCKNIYECARLKFTGSTETELFELVGDYLLENWLLKSMF